MRLSRKAGILACSVLWNKHECVRNEIYDGTYDYGQTPWELIDDGSNPDYYAQGYSSYGIEWDAANKRYVYVPAGSQAHASPSEPGTVYYINPTSIERITVSQTGTYAVYARELLTSPHVEYTYTVGTSLGIARTAKNEYPDTKLGYVYVTVYDGYTIMREGYDTYYAYKKI